MYGRPMARPDAEPRCLPEVPETTESPGANAPSTHGPALVERALGQLGGAVLVLDSALRVAAHSPEATELLGRTVRAGATAASVLCGRGPRRPVAEALAAAGPFRAEAHPQGGPAVAVLGTPLAGGGWLLRLARPPSAVPVSDGALCFHGMWTCDPGMKAMFRVLERVAAEDVSVLVRGESGAGKELAAHALHALSPRARGPFQAINCAALPANLLESELFGHVRGAFTGAVKDHPGHFQLADGGTLFLDEVADLPLDLQAKLLRAVETRTVLPVGAQRAVPVDVRIVSATHRDLRAEVEAGRFRADLMFRLRVVPIAVPPLRERRGDIPLLLQTHIDTLNRRGRRRVERVSPEALGRLCAYDYPGNVRELRNFLAYAFAIGEGPTLLESELPPEVFETAPPTAPGGPAAVPPEARARLAAALAAAGGRKDAAAAALGMSRTTLWRRLRAAGLAGNVGGGPPA